jgi:hypothetical protein
VVRHGRPSGQHRRLSRRIDGNVSNDEVYLSTQYEGRDIQFSLMCNQEGLGGKYLGDMRRISELGELTFSNPRGVFLPRPEISGLFLKIGVIHSIAAVFVDEWIGNQLRAVVLDGIKERTVDGRLDEHFISRRN